jgi:quercetin dioxygenase-like cupin family protein
VSTVIPSSQARDTETPNAAMTTLASPTLGGTADLALWRVRMRAGQAGPVHRIDREQVWLVEEGAATVQTREATHALAQGDAVVLPPNEERQIIAGPNGLAAIVAGGTGARASVGDEDRGTPPWMR